MSYETNLDNDIELNEELTFSMAALVEAIANNPAIISALEKNLRQTNLKTARRIGNTSGKWAQRQLPQAVLNQNPATKRVF